MDSTLAHANLGSLHMTIDLYGFEENLYSLAWFIFVETMQESTHFQRIVQVDFGDLHT
jgi:hypothetical protein